MIWLKENQRLAGYVPILKKEYSEKEIREMNVYSGYIGWSRLSELVMKIQGIEFSYNAAGYHDWYEFKVQRLADICFDFMFECFFLPSNPGMEKYRSQIFEVFENLTLYKVEEYSEEEVEEKFAQAKRTLEPFISIRTLETIENDKANFIRFAAEVFNNFSNLQKMFADEGYSLTHDIFADCDKNLSEKIYAERKAKTKLNY